MYPLKPDICRFLKFSSHIFYLSGFVPSGFANKYEYRHTFFCSPSCALSALHASYFLISSPKTYFVHIIQIVNLTSIRVETLCYAYERLNSKYSTCSVRRHVTDQGYTQDVAIFLICKLYSPHQFISSLNFVETKYEFERMLSDHKFTYTGAQTWHQNSTLWLPAYQYSASMCGPSSRSMCIWTFLDTMPASKYTGNSSSSSNISSSF